MRIHVVTPITTPGLSVVDDFASIARADTVASQVDIAEGPSSIESYFDEILAGPGILKEVLQANKDGADAILIDCMGDPALGAAREVSDALVLGPAITAMHVAGMLALNFSIVATTESVVPLITELARAYGQSTNLVSIRVVDIPVLELSEEERLHDALFAQSLSAIEQDGAHAIIFGCTGMRGFAERLRSDLDAAGYGGIPVLDPIVVAFKIAEALVDLGLAPSRRTYPKPPARVSTGFPDLELDA